MSSEGWSLELLERVAHDSQKGDYYIDRCDPDRGLLISMSDGAPRFDHGTMVMLGLAGTWLRSGLPRVRIDTVRRLEQLALAEPQERPMAPWPGWVIEYPRGQRTVMLLGSDGNAEPVKLILVINVDDRWSYMALGEKIDFSELGRTAEYLRDGVPDGLSCWREMPALTITSDDRRAWQLMNHVVLNAAIALGQLEGVRRKGAERAARMRGRYPAGDYVLGVLP